MNGFAAPTGMKKAQTNHLPSKGKNDSTAPSTDRPVCPARESRPQLDYGPGKVIIGSSADDFSAKYPGQGKSVIRAIEQRLQLLAQVCEFLAFEILLGAFEHIDRMAERGRVVDLVQRRHRSNTRPFQHPGRLLEV